MATKEEKTERKNLIEKIIKERYDNEPVSDDYPVYSEKNLAFLETLSTDELRDLAELDVDKTDEI